METILFAVLALIAILSALLVITTPAPVISALYLVVSLFSLAGLYVILAAPFVAAIQIIVYAGAVLILILFVIMLLNLKQIEERIAIAWQVTGVVVATVVLVVSFLAIMGSSSLMPSKPDAAGFGKVADVGSILFTKYLYAFEVVSVLLLLAVIGSVAMIRKPDQGESNAN
jgi:NADH-quinone oxidoreductase subunit J